jgi:hypothetical protein
MTAEPPLPLPQRLCVSAAAGCLTCNFTHPLDVIRVQLQTRGGPQFAAPTAVVRNLVYGGAGVRALWSGLTAAYLRQCSYTMVRIGVYSFLLERAGGPAGADFATKVAIGLVSGAVGSFVGNPTEVALVRMADDAKLCNSQKGNYRHALDCVVRMAREGGPATLWKGAAVSVTRAATLNAFQLGFFSQAKQELHARFPAAFPGVNSLQTIFCGAILSSSLAITASMPFDVVKSRLMAQQVSRKGTSTGAEVIYYSGMLDCFHRSVKEDGVSVLFKGWLPAYSKLAPYTVLSFYFVERITQNVFGRGAL